MAALVVYLTGELLLDAIDATDYHRQVKCSFRQMMPSSRTKRRRFARGEKFVSRTYLLLTRLPI